ncbi:hypothetical protein CH63R_07090 [Colletotrichum higginsianum IMI 349063]|uniref:Uncharacterized protein n=1 Tax=Colletotrichum higginsianum (strain IMI 349063) TaxID=759273 RepID=A0A1B7Y8R8_COLHI|nr:hypothetical protein CH63R_07090 [Colletotrichum higginsianum IMI 349063]OBR08325.1 hypothetical protein CH63R_07090 [Colletotrichum higginsianum IMI 349063]
MNAAIKSSPKDIPNASSKKSDLDMRKISSLSPPQMAAGRVVAMLCRGLGMVEGVLTSKSVTQDTGSKSTLWKENSALFCIRIPRG